MVIKRFPILYSKFSKNLIAHGGEPFSSHRRQLLSLSPRIHYTSLEAQPSSLPSPTAHSTHVVLEYTADFDFSVFDHTVPFD